VRACPPLSPPDELSSASQAPSVRGRVACAVSAWNGPLSRTLSARCGSSQAIYFCVQGEGSHPHSPECWLAIADTPSFRWVCAWRASFARFHASSSSTWIADEVSDAEAEWPFAACG
jgi:hypothetical protein